jgi:hypothetical protein
MEGHRLRVGALAWSSTLLSSGGWDKSIFQRDMRAQGDFVSKLSGHKSEVKFFNIFFSLISSLSFFFLLLLFFFFLLEFIQHLYLAFRYIFFSFHEC